MTKDVAIRTCDQFLTNDRTIALFYAATGVTTVKDRWSSTEQDRRCKLVAAWLREIADALDSKGGER